MDDSLNYAVFNATENATWCATMSATWDAGKATATHARWVTIWDIEMLVATDATRDETDGAIEVMLHE